jgi:immunity protein 49 of polymorphic toxin system
MSTQFLPIYLSNATSELEEVMPTVVAARADLEGVLAACQLFRIRGICSLFLAARGGGLLQDLHRSGRAFLHVLRALDDETKLTSKAAPLFDAIASTDWDCAREIATYSRETWNEGEEYEDDFAYARFLMLHFLLGGTPLQCTEILARFEAILDGAADARFDICTAFHRGDSALFERGIAALLEAHAARYKKLGAAEALPPEEVHTEGQLCVEGLALIRLAERKGFPVEEDYLFVPSVAREPLREAFAGDDWQRL